MVVGDLQHQHVISYTLVRFWGLFLAYKSISALLLDTYDKIYKEQKDDYLDLWNLVVEYTYTSSGKSNLMLAVKHQYFSQYGQLQEATLQPVCRDTGLGKSPNLAYAFIVY